MNSLPLQSISQKKAYLQNIIFGKHREASFLIDSKHYNFAFTFLPINYQPTVFFKIKFSDHILWLSLNSLPPIAYFPEKFENVDLTSLPPDIQPIFLESCFEYVINAIEDALEVVLSIEEYTNTPPIDTFDNLLPFVIRIEGLAQRMYGCLYMSTPAVEFLSAILERTPYTRSNRFIANIEIPLHAIIAEETLSFEEFKNLRLQDIILLNDDSFINNGACKVIIGNHLVYNGILKNKRLTLESLMEERIDNDNLQDDSSLEMDQEKLSEESLREERSGEVPSGTEFEEDSDFEEDTDSIVLPHELDNVPINLTFEVGQKRISLSELQTLKRGFIFELENSVERPITIRANGRIIGTGELLQIDKRVGVRVIAFSKK